jgi:hypothetical protein
MLLKRCQPLFPGDAASIGVLQRVVLMTPENIHMNSFMYEPILDMSDEHLRKLSIRGFRRSREPRIGKWK